MIERLFRRNPRESSPIDPAVSEAPADGPLSAEVYHDAARHFLDVQISTMDVPDGKTAQYFSIGSLVLPVTFALLNLETVSRAARISLAIALVFYGLVLVSAAAASLIRGPELSIDPIYQRSANIAKPIRECC
jgi:hypothetical protein